MAPTLVSALAHRIAARKMEREKLPAFKALSSRILIARLEHLAIGISTTTATACTSTRATRIKASSKLPLKQRIAKGEHYGARGIKKNKQIQLDSMSAVRGDTGVTKRGPRKKVLSTLGETRKQRALQPILGKRGREEMERDDYGSGREERSRLVKKYRDNGYVKTKEVAKWAPNMPEAERMVGGMGLGGEEEGGMAWNKSLPLLSMAPWERAVVREKEIYQKFKSRWQTHEVNEREPSYSAQLLTTLEFIS